MIAVNRLGLGYSFICQGTSTRKQRRDLFGFRVELPLVIRSNHSNVEAIPWSAFPKDATSEPVA